MLMAAGTFATSCSDFLDRMPLTEPNNETYLSTENQVRSYINGMYIALPSNTQYGIGVRGEDKNSDNILSEKYDTRLNGEYTAFSGSTEWSIGYQNLRDINYFFNYYANSRFFTRKKLSCKRRNRKKKCINKMDNILCWNI